MQISIITDEVSADFETAVELGVSWGVHDFELRGFYDRRAPAISAYQKEIIGETLSLFGARLIAIAPGLFKVPYPGDAGHRLPIPAIDAGLFDSHQAALREVERHLDELLPASIEFAKQFGVGKIVAFGFHRGGIPAGDAPDGALRALEQAARAVEAAGLELVVEVEEGFWLDTGARTAAAIRAIGNPALGINWDPCNALLAGENPYPDGYTAVHDLVRHVHFKDVIVTSEGGWQFVVQGPFDWPAQLRALAADGYPGHISIETHGRPKVAMAREAVEFVRRSLKPPNSNPGRHRRQVPRGAPVRSG